MNKRLYSFGTAALAIGFIYTMLIIIVGRSHPHYHILLGIGFGILLIGFIASGIESARRRARAKAAAEQAQQRSEARQNVKLHGRPAPRRKGRSK